MMESNLVPAMPGHAAGAAALFDLHTVNVTHDLKNVLAIMRACCRVLAREQTDVVQRRDCVEAMDLAADRVTALTSALLVPDPQDSTPRCVFDIEAALQHAMPLLRAGCGRESTLTICGLRGTRLLVEGVQGDFEAALLNLVLNARDASGDNRTIVVEVRRREAGKVSPDSVQVSVIDSGRGIPPELQARVFEPFFTTKPSRHGAGVGLLRVVEFTRRSNGRISLSSVHGKGSTFTMHLNRAAFARES